jgi:hypothetical protein
MVVKLANSIVGTGKGLQVRIGTEKRYKIVSAIVALLIGYQFRSFKQASIATSKWHHHVVHTSNNNRTSDQPGDNEPTNTSTNATQYGQLDKNHFGLEDKSQILPINNPTTVIPSSKSNDAKNLTEGHFNATSKEGVNLFLNVPANRRPYIYKPGWDTSPVVVEEYKLLFFTQPKVRLCR